MTRYIDADALIEKYTVVIRKTADEKLKTEIAVLLKDIEEQPTVEAVPVKRGKWIDETFEPWGLVHHPFKCNLCGEHAEFASPYCPNCGADMRGEK